MKLKNDSRLLSIISGTYHLSATKLARDQLRERISRLTDAYIDRVIDRDLFEERKTALLAERQRMDETIEALKHDTGAVPVRLADFLELAGSAYLSYREALPHERRRLAEKLTSNRDADGKSLVVTLKSPFAEIANRFALSNSALERNRTPITRSGILRPIR